MDLEEELDPDVFNDYEEFLKDRLTVENDRLRATSLLAHLYYHRVETYASKAAKYAREAIMAAPSKRTASGFSTTQNQARSGTGTSPTTAK